MRADKRMFWGQGPHFSQSLSEKGEYLDFTMKGKENNIICARVQYKRGGIEWDI